MLPTVFFLMLARGSVRYRFAAIFAALLAGSAAMFLGFAKAGPLIVLKYLAVGVVIDGMARLLPGRFRNVFWSGLTGALAGSTKFFTDYATGYLAGMDPASTSRSRCWKEREPPCSDCWPVCCCRLCCVACGPTALFIGSRALT